MIKKKNLNHIFFLFILINNRVLCVNDFISLTYIANCGFLTDPFQTDKYAGIKISELNVDIGLINEDFGKIENAGLAREFVNAKYNVAMHFPDPIAIGWLASLRGKPDLFPNPFIFTKKMEKKVFYTGQEK